MDTITHSATARTRTAFVVAAALLATSIALLAAQGCRSTPVSGRKQLMLIPESQEIQLGVQAYEETLSAEKLSEDADVVAMVERVGRRIAAVAEKPEYDWEFHVIAGDAQNAFALPGGKVAVYEGMLPVCQSEAGLAVVMSHEIAHAIARHGGERMTQESVVKGAGAVVNAVAQKNAEDATARQIMQVYGVSSEYGVILPFSRQHESEADAIGLILMAKAGYDPSVAPEFWERFSSMTGPKPPEWLSTHPADARRAAELRALLPEAMKYYQAAQEQLGMGEAIPVQTLVSTESAPAQAPIKPKAQVAQATPSNPGLPLGPVSALVGRHTVKKGNVTHADHHELADDSRASAVQQAAAEKSADDAQWDSNAVSNADFQLPVKAGESASEAVQETSPRNQIDPNGWEASSGDGWFK